MSVSELCLIYLPYSFPFRVARSPPILLLSVLACQKLAYTSIDVSSSLPEACLYFYCCQFRLARSLPILLWLSVPACQKLAYTSIVVSSSLPEACLYFYCCQFRLARSLPILLLLSVPACQKLAYTSVVASSGLPEAYLNFYSTVVNSELPGVCLCDLWLSVPACRKLAYASSRMHLLYCCQFQVARSLPVSIRQTTLLCNRAKSPNIFVVKKLILYVIYSVSYTGI